MLRLDNNETKTTLVLHSIAINHRPNKRSRTKMIRPQAVLLALSLCCTLAPQAGAAGFDEAAAAYLKNDYATALRVLQPLATQGDASAQSFLGMLYDTGQGVPQDYKEAVRLFRLAADQGNASAQFYLGSMYVRGQGVPQDYKEAVRLFRLSADQGDASAQSILGLMYEYGTGVSPSRVVAYALYNVAAVDSSSENRAAANRTRLAKTMSNPEIEAAQALTRELAKPGGLLKDLDRYRK